MPNDLFSAFSNGQLPLFPSLDPRDHKHQPPWRLLTLSRQILVFIRCQEIVEQFLRVEEEVLPVCINVVDFSFSL